MSKDKPSIIIKKIKKIQGGHHGGAWKVAYADFVTAMMAFFLLLWLISVSDKATLKGVAQYFTPTESVSDKAGLGMSGGIDTNAKEGVGAPHVSASSLIYGAPTQGQKSTVDNLKTNMSEKDRQHFMSIMSTIEQSTELQGFAENIALDITNEGLRIQIMDSNNRPMFKPNTSELQPYMEKIINVIGKMISMQPNYIAISGHTASVKNGEGKNIDFWDVSSSRANEVRKFMSNKLIDKNQVVKITGKADKEPFDPRDPYGVKNMRIGITLLNQDSISDYQKSLPD